MRREGMEISRRDRALPGLENLIVLNINIYVSLFGALRANVLVEYARSC